MSVSTEEMDGNGVYSDEEWRPVTEYEGRFEVSNFGRFRRLPGHMHDVYGHLRFYRGKLLHTFVDRRFGYLRVNLCCDGAQKQKMVHVLVAEAFLESRPSPDHEVNHKDGDKTNPRPENLEWATGSENMLHAYRAGLEQPIRGTNHYNCRLTDDDIRTIRGLVGSTSQTEIAQRFGVSASHVNKILRGRSRVHVAAA